MNWTAGTHPATDNATPCLTLLLVHGIGQQKAGSAIDHVGNAVIAWARARLAPSGGDVVVERAMLKPSERGDSTASASLVLLIVNAAGQPLHRLQLVESLWAAEFDPPGLTSVLRWILGPGTWLLFCQLVAPPARVIRALGGSDTAVHVTGGMVGLIVLSVAVLPLQIAGLLLAPFCLLPIPFVQPAARWMAAIAGDVVGDSYLFAGNPVVRQALADRVRRDLDRISVGTGKIAVLAHSQGAAVVLEMVERHPAPPPVITYGAGIRKLHELGDDRASGLIVPAMANHFWLIALVMTAAVGGAMANVLDVVRGNLEPNQWAGLSFLALAALVVAGFALGSSAVDRAAVLDASMRRRFDRLFQRHPALRWLDLHATADPVPGGALFRAQPPADAGSASPASRLQSRTIVNDDSALTDHTSYWSNPDDFIDRVAAGLAGMLRIRLPLPRLVRLPWWSRRPVRNWIPYLVRKTTQVASVVLFFRAAAQWWRLIPSSTVMAEKAAGALPGIATAAAPLVAGTVQHVWSPAMWVVMLVVHVVAATVFDRMVLGSAWGPLDRQLALDYRPSRRFWLMAVVRLVWYLAIAAVLFAALTHAISSGSYRPFIDVPVHLLLTVHRAIFL